MKEIEVSRDLGISRAPIREAIQNLANEGLVELVPHRGAIVAIFGAEEVRELYEVREALEIMATRLAAERASDRQLTELQGMLETTGIRLEGDVNASYPRDLDFHNRIFELAGNTKLEDMANGITAQLRLARFRSGARPGRAGDSYREHIAVFEALKEKDPNKAEKAMRKHIRNGLTKILDMLANESSTAWSDSPIAARVCIFPLLAATNMDPICETLEPDKAHFSLPRLDRMHCPLRASFAKSKSSAGEGKGAHADLASLRSMMRLIAP